MYTPIYPLYAPFKQPIKQPTKGGTTVGDGSEITQSVVGRGCTIGKGVTIRGSYLWGDITVEDGTFKTRRRRIFEMTK
jgi:NDP-sugar pyrophosphorylase family protein